MAKAREEEDLNEKIRRAMGARIAELRAFRQLTQADLALLAGMKKNSIWMVETGLRGLPLTRIVRVARSLNVLPSVLLSFLDDVEIPDL